MELKTLTRVGSGTTFTVAPGIVMSATPDSAGTGTYLLIRNSSGFCDKEHVTTTVADFIVGTNFIPVTAVGSSASPSKYIRADTISDVQVNSSGSLLILLSDDNGMDQGATLAVTESVADIAALVAAVQESGTGQQVTTSATPTIVNQSSVNVVTVANNGDIVQLSDAFPRTVLVNATNKYFLCTPPDGAQIDTCGTDDGLRILPYSSVEIFRESPTSWTSGIIRQSAQLYTATANGSAKVVTARFARVTIGTSNTNYIEYGDASTGEIPDKVTVANLSTAYRLRVKFADGFIDAVTGAAISTFYGVPTNTTVEMAYDAAVGKVIVYGCQSMPVTGTLVLGAITFNSSNIGQTAAAKIRAGSQFRLNGRPNIYSGTVGAGFTITITPGSSIVIQMVNATGANLTTDVSDIVGEIVF